MLNPCRPCIWPTKGHCEQCIFGYRPVEENHETMKNLIIETNNGEKPFEWRVAERYMECHPDWQTQMEKTK